MSAVFRHEMLQAALADMDPAQAPIEQLERLVAAGLDQLPLPGNGATLDRWQALASVAAYDLSLAKLFEGHTDALAILAELGAPAQAIERRRIWGVWAAESPEGRATFEEAETAGMVRLHGAKCWCSGAAGATDALLTAWGDGATEPQLIAAGIRQAGVRVSDGHWRAVGMAGSASLDVAFDRAHAFRVGREGEYLRRSGFWQGGAGIAACWWGGARAVGEALRRTLADAPTASRGPFRLAALGRIDLALTSTAGLLRSAAAWIDANPTGDARLQALRVRLSAEQCATCVLAEAGRALGAAPYCRDAHFARMAADLPVFIRQSHAERDLAALGEGLLDRESAWAL